MNNKKEKIKIKREHKVSIPRNNMALNRPNNKPNYSFEGKKDSGTRRLPNLI